MSIVFDVQNKGCKFAQKSMPKIQAKTQKGPVKFLENSKTYSFVLISNPGLEINQYRPNHKTFQTQV